MTVRTVLERVPDKIMMNRFVEHVVNGPQTRCRSAEQVGLQMSSERQGGECCGSQGGW